MNILITSAGSPAAVGLIKSINLVQEKTHKNYNITAIDCDPLAAGLFLANNYHVVPPIKDISNPWEFLKNIILKHKINFILPNSESELILFSKNKKNLEKMGVKIWISPLNTINLCNNKFKFWEKLHKDFNMPFYISSKIFSKPDQGAGSRGCKLIETPKNTHLWEYLPGNEYTVDVFCDGNSNSLGTIVRKREGIKAGISVKGSIIRNKYLEEESEKLCKTLNIVGPCNIQWKENESQQPKLIECNPRLGGGTYFSTLAGVNPAEIYLQNIKTKQYPKEIKVTRYFEEIITS
tara:strand:+ start:3897 stop:4775 length:879 start_codon:yes stop_codon:yes gene_type:complete